jgi:hypothetical protein
MASKATIRGQKLVLESLICSPFNHLTRLLAPQYLIEIGCREGFIVHRVIQNDGLDFISIDVRN